MLGGNAGNHEGPKHRASARFVNPGFHELRLAAAYITVGRWPHEVAIKKWGTRTWFAMHWMWVVVLIWLGHSWSVVAVSLST